GFVVAPLHVRENAFPLPRQFRLAAFLREAVQQHFPHALGQFSPRRVELELELLGERGEDHTAEVSVGLAPREHDALEDGDSRIAKYELRARRPARAEAAARRARPERRVEREVSGLELRHREAAVRAAVLLAE